MFKRLALTLLLPVCGLYALDGAWNLHNSFADVRDLAYHSGNLYCATSGGLQVIDIATGATRGYTQADGLGGSGVSAVAVDRDNGRVYLALDNGNLSIFDGGPFRTYTDFKSQTGIRFQKLAVYRGTLLIGTSEGLGFFAEDDGARVYPFFSMFGDATNPFLNRASGIRDLQIVNDTVYVLTRYFWAKMPLDWTKPLAQHNPGFTLVVPTLWTTNGAAGDFAYRVQVDGEWDTVGYNRFALSASTVNGLLDTATCDAPDGIRYSLRDSAGTIWIKANGTALAASFPRPVIGAARFTGLTVDNNGRFYAGTSGQGVLRLSDNRSYWNGDEQSFSNYKDLKTDVLGNVYCSSVETPGDAFSNQSNSLGILKFDGHNWSHILPLLPSGFSPGSNEFLIDKFGRLIATCGDLAGTINGLIVFNNPSLDTSFSFNGTVLGPYQWSHASRFGPVYTITATVAQTNPRYYSDSACHIPTALCTDEPGNLYFTFSAYVYDSTAPIAYPFRHPGDIRVLSMDNAVTQTSWNGRLLNIPTDTVLTPGGGYRQLGRIRVPNDPDNYQADGHYNSIAVDKAGNVWAVGQSRSKLNVFGKRRSASQGDTLVFDEYNTITQYLYRPRRTSNEKLEAECKSGLDAHQVSKTVRKVRTDLYGDIWISTTAGLFYYTSGRDSLDFGNCGGLWRYFLPDVSINGFDFDSLNNVWIATEGLGLKMLRFSTARYPTDENPYGVGNREGIRIDSYSEFDGLLSNRVLSVAVHRKSGKVFTGYDNGLLEFESGIRIADDVTKGYVYPVLVRGQGQTLYLNTRQNGAAIAVYSVSGTLVYHYKLDSERSGIVWNTRNPAGRPIATGVYLYRFTAPNGKSQTGKFAVVR
ncbi:MAG: hypothetical protein V1913_06935 [Fibrobacterota bacterium]